MTDSRGLDAWRAYKHQRRDYPRRQLRRRDFLAGYAYGVADERERTQKYVIPHTLRLHDLIKAMSEDPTLADRIRAEIPETVKALTKMLDPRKKD